MKVSLEQRIFRYLKSRPMKKVSGIEIEDLSRDAGYKSSTGGRRARELAERGVIKGEVINGNVVYWYIPSQALKTPLGAIKTLTLAV